MSDNLAKKLADLEEHSKTMKSEIDALQIALIKPWYKEAATIVACLALLFSFGTTLISSVNARNEQRRDYQIELRGLVQKLLTIPAEQAKEAAEMQAQFGAQHPAVAGYAALQSQKMLLLARQAENITREIPDLVSTKDYLAISSVYIGHGEYDRGMDILKIALDVADNIVDEVTVMRNFGQVAYLTGDVIAGKSYYKKAIDISEEGILKQQIDPQVQLHTDSTTYLYWAQQEVLTADCFSATNLYNKALETANKLVVQYKHNMLTEIGKSMNLGCPISPNNSPNEISFTKTTSQ